MSYYFLGLDGEGCHKYKHTRTPTHSHTGMAGKSTDTGPPIQQLLAKHERARRLLEARQEIERTNAEVRELLRQEEEEEAAANETVVQEKMKEHVDMDRVNAFVQKVGVQSYVYTPPWEHMKNFPWWHLHCKDKGGFCMVCIHAGQHSKNKTWTQKPSNNSSRYGWAGVKKHGDSASHQQALEILKASATGVNGAASTTKNASTLGQEVVEVMRKRFKEVYWLLKNDLALRKFASLLELEELNGAYDQCIGVLKGGIAGRSTTAAISSRRCWSALLRSCDSVLSLIVWPRTRRWRR